MPFAGLVIALLVGLAYANSFHGAFTYDDIPAIVDNATLRHGWRLAQVLFPPPNTTVSGRPVLNASFALNHAISGGAVWSYHALNLLIHVAAALTLFGLVRRTLARTARALADAAGHPPSRPGTRPRFSAEAALPVAIGVALLWALHPLATEAVDYIVQRAESLMTLFLLLTVYCFVRAVDAGADDLGPIDLAGATAGSEEMNAPRGSGGVGWIPWARGPAAWFCASVLGCTLGMATKENMAAAPLLVLLYDRTFISGSFAAVWRRRAAYYIALFATWVLLGALIITTGGDRSGTVGFGTGVSPVDYWITQAPALARYFALSMWPSPLVFDYGTPWVAHPIEVLPQACVVVAALGVSVWALWQRPRLGFLAAWFWAVLAPTSIVPGKAQMIVEHRMYGPLAALVTLAVLGAWVAWNRRSLPILAAIAVGFAGVTFGRNTAYRSEAGLWVDTAAKCPTNARAYFTVASGLQASGRMEEAIIWYKRALQAFPAFLEARNNLGNVLCQLRRYDEALADYEQALQIAPNSAGANNNVGNVLASLGRFADAIPHFRRAIQLDPTFRDAYLNLGTVFMQLERWEEAIPYYEHAVELDDEKPDGHVNLADALVHAHHPQAALPHFETAITREPDDAELHAMYGNALADVNRVDEALRQFAIAVKLDPASFAFHFNYGATLLAARRSAEARAQFEAALRAKPDFVPARQALEQLGPAP